MSPPTLNKTSKEPALKQKTLLLCLPIPLWRPKQEVIKAEVTKSMAEDIAPVNILEKPRFNEDPQYYLPGHNLFFFIFAEKAPPDLDIIVKEKVAG